MSDHKKIFIFFIVISLIALFPTKGAGLVYDFIGWQEEYDVGSWSDILNCFGYPGLHQALHLVFFSLYKLFGVSAFWWYFVFALLHGGVGYLIYLWIHKLTKTLKIELFTGAPIVAGLIFIFNPYNIEVVVWKVCVHYLMSSIWLLGIMINYLNYLAAPKRKYLYRIYALFAVSLFTLEISYITPITMLLTIITCSAISKSLQDFYTGLKFVFLPLMGMLAVLLLTNKIVLGEWVGHYGADTHLNIDFIAFASNETKYFIKHFFFLRFGSFDLKNAVFDSLNSRLYSFYALLSILMLIVFWLTRLLKHEKKLHLIFYSLFGFFLCVLPVANLFFYHLSYGQNDRFDYIPQIFFSLFMVSIFSYLPKITKWVVIAGYLVISIFFFGKMVFIWNQNAQVFNGLNSEFRWYDRDKVVMLNVPDDFQGTVMYSTISEPSGFAENIQYIRRKKFEGEMYDAFLYNMNKIDEGVTVSQINNRTIKVELNQWGNWWHYDGIGASDYENELYKIRNKGHHYELELKDKGLDATFIYQDGLKLHEFKFDPNWTNKPNE